MALGSFLSCIRYLMFAFNFLFWLLGCAILGIGIWVLVDENIAEFNTFLGLLNTGAYILIAVGVIIMIVGFLGCCGALKESQCMLGTFFICLFIIFAVLLGAGIWAVVEKAQVRDYASARLKDFVKRYNDPDYPEAMSAMDFVQSTFSCCGSTEGVDEYDGLMPGQKPKSCKPEAYHDPCEPKVYEFVSDKLVIIAGIAMGVALILILGMVFAMILCCAIRDSVPQA